MRNARRRIVVLVSLATLLLLASCMDVTTSLTRHRRAEYPVTTAHSHQVNHAPI